jgi:hypothetical protein
MKQGLAVDRLSHSVAVAVAGVGPKESGPFRRDVSISRKRVVELMKGGHAA